MKILSDFFYVFFFFCCFNEYPQPMFWSKNKGKKGIPLHANFYIHVYNSVLRPFQDYFSSHETDQSVGRAKTGEPREKPPDTPASLYPSFAI